MLDIEAIQASASEVMKWDVSIRVRTVRNHDYCSSKAARKPPKSYLALGIWKEQWDKCTVRLTLTGSHAKLRLMCAILTNGGAMQTHG
jgi:hypothetical protein